MAEWPHDWTPAFGSSPVDPRQKMYFDETYSFLINYKLISNSGVGLTNHILSKILK